MTRNALIIASTRRERFADRPATWVPERPRREVGCGRDRWSPMYAPRQYAAPAIAEFGRRIDEADGYIGVFKNAADHLSAE